jgi:predicted glycoside hydrolase/deacetylase ChbG (UPF0249 family)
MIVNADDFGQSGGVNAGIIRAYEQGIVTSTSLMVRWPHTREAAEYAKDHPQLSLGLHFDLGEWTYKNGNWQPVYEVVSLDRPREVAAEISRQLDAFRVLLGREPTHLDSHQHVHRREPACGIVMAIGKSLGIPVRHCTPLVQYRGEFYGQTGSGESDPEAISVKALLRLIASVKPGVSELVCHPAEADNHLSTMYCRERQQEMSVLCEPCILSALETYRVELCSFSDFQVLTDQG